MRRVYQIFGVAMGLLLAAYVYVALDNVTDANTALAEKNGKQDEGISALQAIVEAQNQKLEELGEQPVADPEDVVPDSDDDGPILIAGPRGAMGPIGPQGRPGPASTVAGPAGPPGASSTVPGPSGPSGSDGNDGAAGKDGVDGAKGDRGEPGKDGADGKDGRGITSTTCSDGRWTVTYTDGSAEDAGACVPSLPVPTP